MSELDKASATQAESVKKGSRKRGCVGHCLKFWWAYLIGFIVFVVLLVCLIILVAVPKIAQGKLDDAELTIQGIVISRTESNSLDMAINSTITTDGKVHANIDGFEGVMYLEDLEPHTPFARINFPATTADALQTVNVSQKLEITNMEALTTFNTWLLSKDEVRITTLGQTHVRVKGISRASPVTFKKTITTPGLRGFDGTTVFNTSITIAPDSLGNNFKGLTNIPNYSVFTLEIGNATFFNYLLGKEVGTVYIDNIILYPGMNNTFPMRATIEQGPVLSALSQKPYCDEAKGVLPLQIRGKSVSNFGQSLSYFADALGSHNQTLDVDVGTPVSKLLGGPVKCAAAGGTETH